MNIFHKRPLALILCITAGGFVISTQLGRFAAITLSLISLLIFIGSFLIKRIKPYALIARGAAIALLIATLFSYFYFNFWFKADKIYDGRIEIEATVSEAVPVSSYSTKLTLHTDKIRGEFKKGYKFVAYLPTDEVLNVTPGSVITFSAILHGLDKDDTTQFNYSKGINARCDGIEDLKIIGKKDFYVPALLFYIREYTSRYTMLLSDRETGSLLCALLIGERDYLSGQVRLDFKRIGISHILALSGMHLAILALGIDKMLKIFTVKKRARFAITISLVLLYMLFTGFSVSVRRAGFMLIIYSALFLMSKSRDSLTSLFLAVNIILFTTPYSVYDIALWLSAFATFGIIILAEYRMGRKRVTKRYKRLLVIALDSILASVFAISATILFTTIVFGGISLIGVFATVLFSLLIEIIMYLGCIMLVVGHFIPIGKLLSPLCHITVDLSHALASPDFIYLPNYTAISVILAILTSGALFAFAVLKLKNKTPALLILCSLFVISHITPLVQYGFARNDYQVSYYSSHRSDIFITKSKGEVCAVNSANYSETNAYFLRDLLQKEKVVFLDKYFITHYSRSVEDDLRIILSNIKTLEILLPSPRNEDEKSILRKLSTIANEHGTTITELSVGRSVDIGALSLMLLYSAPYGEESSRNAFAFYATGQTITYMSQGMLDGETQGKMLDYLNCSDQIILGSHGRSYKKKQYFDDAFDKASRLIICSEKIYLTQNAYSESIKNGCDIQSHPSEVVLIDE